MKTMKQIKKPVSIIAIVVCVLILLIGFFSFTGSNRPNVVSKRVDESTVLLNRSNKIPLSLDLSFNNLFTEKKKTTLFTEHYKNGKLVEKKGLLSSSIESDSLDSTTAKISILNLDGKNIYVNSLYNESAIGSRKIKFAKAYEIYDYDKVQGAIKVDKNKKVILGYFGGSDNQNLGRPITARDVDVKKYPEIITIVLETSDK